MPAFIVCIRGVCVSARRVENNWIASRANANEQRKHKIKKTSKKKWLPCFWLAAVRLLPINIIIINVVYITILNLLLSVRSFLFHFSFSLLVSSLRLALLAAARFYISPMNFFLFRKYIVLAGDGAGAGAGAAANAFHRSFVSFVFLCRFRLFFVSVRPECACMSRCCFSHLIRSQYEQRKNARTYVCWAHSKQPMTTAASCYRLAADASVVSQNEHNRQFGPCTAHMLWAQLVAGAVALVQCSGSMCLCTLQCTGTPIEANAQLLVFLFLFLSKPRSVLHWTSRQRNYFNHQNGLI